MAMMAGRRRAGKQRGLEGAGRWRARHLPAPRGRKRGKGAGRGEGATGETDMYCTGVRGEGEGPQQDTPQLYQCPDVVPRLRLCRAPEPHGASWLCRAPSPSSLRLPASPLAFDSLERAETWNRPPFLWRCFLTSGLCARVPACLPVFGWLVSVVVRRSPVELRLLTAARMGARSRRGCRQRRRRRRLTRGHRQLNWRERRHG